MEMVLVSALLTLCREGIAPTLFLSLTLPLPLQGENMGSWADVAECIVNLNVFLLEALFWAKCCIFNRKTDAGMIDDNVDVALLLGQI